MDDQHDSAQLGGGNRLAPVAASEIWLPYAEALALAQKICGPSYPPAAALSVLRRAFEVWASATGRGRNQVEKGAVARFPRKLVLRHLEAAAARFYDHPTSWPPITEERWREEWEEDKFTSWLPSIEAALGGDPADWRQPRGEPWTAENTEWRLDTLRTALADPDVNPGVALDGTRSQEPMEGAKVAPGLQLPRDEVDAAVPYLREEVHGPVSEVASPPEVTSLPEVAEPPDTADKDVSSGSADLQVGRPPLPTKLLADEMERRAEAGTLTGNWSHDSASLSAWFKGDDQKKMGAPSTIRTHKGLRDTYKKLIGRRP